MSDLFKPFGKSYTYTESELDEMGEILLTAEDIKKDDKLHRMVLQHLEEKSGKITSIQDLRDLANGKKPEGNSERKRL